MCDYDLCGECVRENIVEYSTLPLRYPRIHAEDILKETFTQHCNIDMLLNYRAASRASERIINDLLPITLYHAQLWHGAPSEGESDYVGDFA